MQARIRLSRVWLQSTTSHIFYQPEKYCFFWRWGSILFLLRTNQIILFHLLERVFYCRPYTHPPLHHPLSPMLKDSFGRKNASSYFIILHLFSPVLTVSFIPPFLFISSSIRNLICISQNLFLCLFISFRFPSFCSIKLFDKAHNSENFFVNCCCLPCIMTFLQGSRWVWTWHRLQQKNSLNFKQHKDHAGLQGKGGRRGRGRQREGTHWHTHIHIYLIRKLNLGRLLTFHMSLGSEVWKTSLFLVREVFVSFWC